MGMQDRWTGGKDHPKPSGRVGRKSHRASCRLVLVVRDGTDAFRPKTAYQNEEAYLYSAAAEQEGSAGVAWARTSGSTRLGSRLHA